MDPISAIGLAGNLLQISQFAVDLLAKAKEIHKAGTTKDNKVLEDIVTNLNKAAGEIQNISKSGLSKHESLLCTLATQCQGQSEELLSLLHNITADGQNSLASFKAAWKHLRLADTKRELETRLEQTKSQIVLQLSHMTRFELNNKLDELKEQRMEDSKEIQHLQYNVDILIRGLYAVRGWADPTILAPLKDMAQSSEESIHTIQKRNTILAAVRFEMMEERFDDVEVAHQHTFEWIFNSGNTTNSISNGFPEWLRTGGGIFHLCGKAGAGKSTLMKSVCSHPRTEQLLVEWSGDQRLVTSRFFFWKPGTPRQRNVKGLIRGLFYHIISQTPEVIPDILQLEWTEATYARSIVIDDSRLLAAFDKLILCPSFHLGHKYMFFIDGLDELDGNQRGLVERLKRWTDSAPNTVKVCVSSREDNIFMDSFLDSQRIRIQDLTRGDMSQLVWDTLSSHHRFVETVKPDTLRQSLSDAIVRHSDGIFLWVVLVLRTVMEGLDNGDSLPRLEQKVIAMPQGLEAMFDQIFQSINDLDRHLVYLHLSFRLHSRRGCTLLRHSFLPDIEDDPSFAQRIPVDNVESNSLNDRLVASERLEARICLAKRRLNGMCKGLLEIHKPPPHPSNGQFLYHVDFTHRSIVEFLMARKEFLEFLDGNLDTVYRLLGESLIAEMKTADNAVGLSFSPEFRYISWAWNEIRHIVTRTLDIFSTVPDWLPMFLQAAQYIVSKRIAPVQHKSLKTPRFLHTYNGMSHLVMSMALPARPDFYSILYDADFEQVGDILPPALLAKAVSSLLNQNYSTTISCMEFLFSKGLSPNCRLVDSTDRALKDAVSISIWHVFLCVAMHWTDTWWQDDSWRANVCEVMNYWLSQGADPRFKAHYRPTTTQVLDERQVFLVTIKYEDGQSLPFPTLAAPGSRLVQFIKDKEFSIGLLDIFDFLQVECTAKLEIAQRTLGQEGLEDSLISNDEAVACDHFQTMYPEATKLVGLQKPLTWMEVSFIEGGAFRLARHTHQTINHVFEGLVKAGHMLPPI